MHSTAVYDQIGKSYDLTRKADPQIVSRLIELLSPTKDGSYLDVGCGSGNYTDAIFKKGFKISGLDLSDEMLKKARIKNAEIQWIHGDAKQMPFSSDTFDGAICILATHHIKDIQAAFQEIYRILKKGNFIIFTSFPEQMKRYWLHAYFPKMLQKSQMAMTSHEKLAENLSLAGFTHVRVDKFFVNKELEDLFLQAGKYRPELYLDPQIRDGISSFILEEHQDEIHSGCQKLQQDINTGEINKIIASYESDLGDYAFITCSKL